MSQHLRVTVSLIEKSKDSAEQTVTLTEIEKMLPEDQVTVEGIERTVRDASNEARKVSYFKTLEYYDAQVSEKRQHSNPDCEVIFNGKKTCNCK